MLSLADAPCPMEPLLEGIRRRIWNSQQKCAQALHRLLERGDGKQSNALRAPWRGREGGTVPPSPGGGERRRYP